MAGVFGDFGDFGLPKENGLSVEKPGDFGDLDGGGGIDSASASVSSFGDCPSSCPDWTSPSGLTGVA